MNTITQVVSIIALVLGVIGTSLGIWNTASRLLAKPNLKGSVEDFRRITLRSDTWQHYVIHLVLLLWNEGKATSYVTNIQLLAGKKSMQPLSANVSLEHVLRTEHQKLDELPRSTRLFKYSPGQIQRHSFWFLLDAGPGGLDFDAFKTLSIIRHKQNALQLAVDSLKNENKPLTFESLNSYSQ